MKRSCAVLLCLALLLLLGAAALPIQARAATDYAVSSNISGADIYVNGVFTGLVTPATVSAASAAAVTVRLPGYTSAAMTGAQSVYFTLSPEQYPSSYQYKTTLLTVGATDGPATLEAAVAIALADTEDTWYVIQFADSISTVSVSAPVNLNARGRLTIDGRRKNGSRLKIAKADGFLDWLGAINVITANVRLIGLDFDNTGLEQSSYLSLRVPDANTEKYDIDNVYVLGCRFANTFEVGIATCGARGYGGTAYGGAGTTNFSNLVFAGNVFEHTGLFSFAGAGDEDYNVVDGYKVCGNTFTDGGIGLLAGDAHTWYVFGYDNQSEPAYCEHNIFRNVLLSGNRITMTTAATHVYEGIIGVSCANLGNSNNTTEHVVIRNNTARITGGDANQFSTVRVGNVSVSDNYSEDGSSMDGYAPYLTAGLTHTDNNTLRDVRVYANDFQLGTGGALSVCNVNVDVGQQQGRDNAMENIDIHDNRIEAQSGVKIANYQGNHKSSLCAGNDMRDISFSGNTVLRSEQAYNEAGVTVAGSLVGNHGQTAADYPRYGGTMSGVTVADNTVTGYQYGVVVAGSAGDYGVGLGVSEVAVRGNTITTALYHEYMEHDFGIVIAGSCLQTVGKSGDASSPLQPSNLSCFARNVTVTDNQVTAQGGILVTGNLVGSAGLGNPTGNYVSGVTLRGNTLTHRAETTATPATLPAILILSAVDPWNRLAEAGEGVEAADYFAGCFVENVTVGDNTESGFAAPDLLLYDAAAPAGWDSLPGGLYARSLRDSTSLERGYFLPTQGLLHLTVKCTGYTAGDSTAIGAFYDRSGKLLALRVGGDWSRDTLTLVFDRAETDPALGGKVFLLDNGLVPRRAALEVMP